LVLSPTRTYAPIIKQALNTINPTTLNGIVHCSGGGQTKVLHFVNDIHVIKDSLFTVPPLFQMIKEEAKTPWKEMYKVFNMGHRMELYVHSDQTVKEIIDIAHSFNVDAKVVGYVEAAKQKKLTIKSKYGEFIY
jgi:phosphoribosylformylglycinamidine cyclo-ligase